jgi:protoporphyrinogen oxidase
LAVAVPPSAAAELLADEFPELAEVIGGIRSVPVDSVGVTVRAERLAIELVAGIIPVERDLFYSAVSRDVVPDGAFRGFAFHFRPGTDEDSALTRIAEVLGVDKGAFESVTRRTVSLPSPVLGHGQTVSRIDALTANLPVAVLGAYFDGLAIEDCALRSHGEFRRLSGGRSVA